MLLADDRVIEWRYWVRDKTYYYLVDYIKSSGYLISLHKLVAKAVFTQIKTTTTPIALCPYKDR